MLNQQMDLHSAGSGDNIDCLFFKLAFPTITSPFVYSFKETRSCVRRFYFFLNMLNVSVLFFHVFLFFFFMNGISFCTSRHTIVQARNGIAV